MHQNVIWRENSCSPQIAIATVSNGFQGTKTLARSSPVTNICVVVAKHDAIGGQYLLTMTVLEMYHHLTECCSYMAITRTVMNTSNSNGSNK